MLDVMNLHELAEHLRVSAAWLKTQTKAGRLPHVRAGGTTLYNPVAVRAALAEMASRPLANAETEVTSNASTH